MDDATKESVKTSLQTDGCAAKKILDEVDFKDALKVLMEIGRDRGNGLYTRVWASGDTAFVPPHALLHDTNNKPAINVEIKGRTGLLPWTAYTASEYFSKDGTMERRSWAPYCKEKSPIK